MTILNQGLLARAGRRLIVAPLGFALACATSHDADSPAARAAAIERDPSDYAVPNAFGLSLLQRQVRAAPDTNAVLSPTSAATALQMVIEGAGSSTREALTHALSPTGRDTSGAESPRRGDPGDITLSVANAVWAGDGIAFNEAFIDRLRTRYDAEVSTANLQSPEGVERINAWASKATQGKISRILSEPMTAEAVLLLANAVYFKGKWADPFDSASTTNRTFRPASGAPHSVPLMSREGEYGYLRENGVQIARLPYRGNRFAMYVVLPDSASSAKKELGRVDTRWLDAAGKRLAPHLLQLSLPRFRVDATIDLKQPLTDLGAGIAFDRDRADFAPMFTPQQVEHHRTWIDRAVQKVFIDVSEEGTEAAAVTAIGVSLDSSVGPVPIPFIVDRAFIFAIRDDSTGELLFIGYIADPAAKS